jgi:hypothetical protein
MATARQDQQAGQSEVAQPAAYPETRFRFHEFSLGEARAAPGYLLSSSYIGARKGVCLLEMPITPQITLLPVAEAAAVGEAAQPGWKRELAQNRSNPARKSE